MLVVSYEGQVVLGITCVFVYLNIITRASWSGLEDHLYLLVVVGQHHQHKLQEVRTSRVPLECLMQRQSECRYSNPKQHLDCAFTKVAFGCYMGTLVAPGWS